MRYDSEVPYVPYNKVALGLKMHNEYLIFTIIYAYYTLKPWIFIEVTKIVCFIFDVLLVK